MLVDEKGGGFGGEKLRSWEVMDYQPGMPGVPGVLGPDSASPLFVSTVWGDDLQGLQ